jgi:ribosomal protein S18 acetylase RimI-like enzyme
MNNSFSICPATLDDAEHIALAVCMAVGYDSTHALYPVFLQLARREHSQYSYLNALVAEADGAVVAALVGYDGARLKELREPIFPLLRQHLGEVIDIEDETEAGEFYLDSLGVVPDYRGRGIGRALIEAMRDRAFAEGHTRVGLIVDVDNPSAERLYKSLGFKRVGNKRFLGHAMHHLQVWR